MFWWWLWCVVLAVRLNNRSMGLLLRGSRLCARWIAGSSHQGWRIFAARRHGRVRRLGAICGRCARWLWGRITNCKAQRAQAREGEDWPVNLPTYTAIYLSIEWRAAMQKARGARTHVLESRISCSMTLRSASGKSSSFCSSAATEPTESLFMSNGNCTSFSVSAKEEGHQRWCTAPI